jgi:hypothetical protein
MEYLTLPTIGLLTATLLTIKHTKTSIQAVHFETRRLASATIEIQDKLQASGQELTSRLMTASSSPQLLTEYGQRLLEESGFIESLNEHKQTLIAAVSRKKITSVKDIEQKSIEVIRELLATNHVSLQSLQSYAYTSGMLASALVPAAGLKLRDEVVRDIREPSFASA